MLKVYETKVPGDRERPLPDGRVFQKYEYPFTDSEYGDVVLSIGVDMTERKRMEEEIVRMNRNLLHRVDEEVEKQMEQRRMLVRQSKMAAMGEMIGAIAHQWRQPLNTLGLIIQDLPEAHRFGELDDEYLNQTVKKVMRQVNFMAQTISDFRDFFRPEKEPVPFDPLRGTLDVLELLGSQLKSQGIAVFIRCREGEKLLLEQEVKLGSGERGGEDTSPLPAIVGYPNEFKQVILNIVNNAKDAILARNGEWGQGRVELRFLWEGEILSLEIEDNGGGIPPSVLEKIFDPYFTTKNSDTGEEGTGIGLYMAKTIIEENMKGTLRVENSAASDPGACFTLLLPIAR